MRRTFLASLLCLALLPLPFVAATSAPTANLRVTEILPEPDTTLGQREFVEVWNAGNATIDLQGWKLHDAPTTSGSTNTFTFPSWPLRPNGRVVVWGGGAGDAHGPAWSNSAVWNNAGDGVFLVDPATTLVDWAGYGTTTAPAGFESHLSAKPDKALSTELQEGTWVAHEPTPGTAPGASAGTATVTVTNVAPHVAFVGLPDSARPGTSLAMQLDVGDDNGATDVVAWNLTSNGVQVAKGAGAAGMVTVAVPSSGTSWTLVLRALDAGGLTAVATANLALRASDLAVALPAGGLAFPDVAPGAASAVVAQPFSIQNLGSADHVPLVDVSDFVGPSVVPAVGHLQVGTGPADAIAWTPYTGALTPLPTLAAGTTVQVWLRLADVPVPLAAGAYGTSFTVVAA